MSLAAPAAGRRAWLEPAAWIVVFLGVQYHAGLLGRHWLGADNGTATWPWHAWVCAVRQGRPAFAPVPEMALGYPLWVEPQSGLFYPLNTAWLPWLDPLTGFTLKILAHVVWGAAGVYRLARACGLSQRGAALAALALANGQWVAQRLVVVPLLLPMAWMPWAALCFRQALARDLGRWLPLAVACQALGLLAGQPQMALATALLCVALAADAQPPEVPWTRRLLRAVGWYLVASVAVLALTCPLWSAALAHVPSERAGQADLAFITQFGFTLRQTMVQLIGGLRTEAAEASACAGSAAALALVVGWRLGPRWRVWVVLAAAGLALSWTVGNPLWRALACVPVVNRFRAGPRYAVLLALAAAMLLGALHDRLEGLTGRERRLAVGGGCGLLLVALVVGVSGSPPVRLALWPVSLACLALSAVAVGRPWGAHTPWAQRALCAAVGVELLALSTLALPATTRAAFEATRPMRQAALSRQAMADAPGAVVALKGIPTNHSLLAGVRQATCFAGLWLPGLEHVHEWMTGVRNPAALAAWGVRWVWLPDARYRGWKLRTLAQVDESVLCEVPGPVLSAYAPQQLIPITTRHAQDAIVAPHADPVRAAIVGDTLIPPGYQPGPTSVTVLRDEPTRLDVRVTSRGGTAVVATRCWSTCWHAAVDGVPVPTSVANLFLLAAPVPPGEHTVSFEYRVDLSTEARAAGAAWLLLLLALVAGLRRKGIA